MQDSEILISEKKKILVADKEYFIGKITLRQIIQLSRFVSTTLISSRERLAKIAEVTKGSKNNADDIIAILEILDEKEISKLFGIILQTDDIDFLAENLNLENMTEIIASVFEINDFENVKKNAERIRKGMTAKKEN